MLILITILGLAREPSPDHPQYHSLSEVKGITNPSYDSFSKKRTSFNNPNNNYAPPPPPRLITGDE